jgi:hypothetical protein
MKTENIKNEAMDKVVDLTENAKKAYDTGTKEAVKGGKDWYEYVTTHPVQSIVFGVIGYFAIKGAIS